MSQDLKMGEVFVHISLKDEVGNAVITNQPPPSPPPPPSKEKEEKKEPSPPVPPTVPSVQPFKPTTEDEHYSKLTEDQRSLLDRLRSGTATAAETYSAFKYTQRLSRGEKGRAIRESGVEYEKHIRGGIGFLQTADMEAVIGGKPREKLMELDAFSKAHEPGIEGLDVARRELAKNISTALQEKNAKALSDYELDKIRRNSLEIAETTYRSERNRWASSKDFGRELPLVTPDISRMFSETAVSPKRTPEPTKAIEQRPTVRLSEKEAETLEAEERKEPTIPPVSLVDTEGTSTIDVIERTLRNLGDVQRKKVYYEREAKKPGRIGEEEERYETAKIGPFRTVLGIQEERREEEVPPTSTLFTTHGKGFGGREMLLDLREMMSKDEEMKRKMDELAKAVEQGNKEQADAKKEIVDAIGSAIERATRDGDGDDVLKRFLSVWNQYKGR